MSLPVFSFQKYVLLMFLFENVISAKTAVYFLSI